MMDSKRLIGLAIGLYLALSVAALMVSADEDEQQQQTGQQFNGFEKAGGQLMDMLGVGPANSAKTDSRKATGMEKPYQEKEEQHHKDPFNLASEYAKLMLNPIALIKRISHDFNLPKNILIEKVGKGSVVGAEGLFSQVISGIKIIEKAFVPNQCRLKFMCQFGTRLGFMKETMLKLSPNVLDGSNHLRALSYGIIGRDCAQTFADCKSEPTLQNSFRDLKEPKQEENQKSYQ